MRRCAAGSVRESPLLNHLKQSDHRGPGHRVFLAKRKQPRDFIPDPNRHRVGRSLRGNRIMVRTLTMSLIAVLALGACSKSAGPDAASGPPTTGAAPIKSVASPEDKIAQSDLRNALAVGKTFFTNDDSYAGFNPMVGTKILARFSPDLADQLTFDESATASVRTVSIRAVTPTTLLLASKSASGTVYCLADNATGTTYGTTDAQILGECADPSW